MNKRPVNLDTYRIDVVTGETTRHLEQGAPQGNVLLDRAGNPAFHSRLTDDGTWEFSAVDPDGELRLLRTAGGAEHPLWVDPAATARCPLPDDEHRRSAPVSPARSIAALPINAAMRRMRRRPLHPCGGTMFKRHKRRWQLSRAKPGDGSRLQRFRFWHRLSRSLFALELPDESGRPHRRR
jgi:hypothetical protein